jgi:cGMP-dependent protein kinase 2
VLKPGHFTSAKVAELRSGSGFGELALLYGSPRAAQAIPLEPAYLVVLSKELFDRVIKSSQTRQIERNFEFLKSASIMDKVPDEVLQQFAKTAQFQTHTIGSVLSR